MKTVVLLLCMLSSIAIFGQAKKDPPAVCAKQDKCSELGRTKLLAAYQKALIAQQAAVQAQQSLQADAQTYAALQKEVAAEEGQPEGTQYQPDVNAGTITAVPPAPKKAEAKPEPKK